MAGDGYTGGMEETGYDEEEEGNMGAGLVPPPPFVLMWWRVRWCGTRTTTMRRLTRGSLRSPQTTRSLSFRISLEF